MPRFLLILLCVALSDTLLANDPNYAYPIRDPLLATVLGTPPEQAAEVDFDVPRTDQEIVIFPQRKLPRIVARDTYRYALTAQDEAAPLIFLIAGTGSSHRGDRMRLLDAAFYAAGFHVVSLSSPTFANFVNTASSSQVPGRNRDDAADLYRVMQKILQAHESELEVTGFHVAGYSLGGMNAAFLSLLDETRQVFAFERVLMINPPVSLYAAADILDGMLDDNIPGPAAPDLSTFFERVMANLSDIYRRNEDLTFNDEFLYRVYRAGVAEGTTLPSEDLEALIGTAFRLASASMITTTDLHIQRGFILPKNHRFRIAESTTPYFKVAARTSFRDYFDGLYVPFFRERDPGTTRADLIEEGSLHSIASYLRDSKKIGVVHNADDIILGPGELDFFREVFGDRAKIYPHGGHCGNMAFPDNLTAMVGFFKDSGT